MRITESQLRRIVREETARTLVEEGRISSRAAREILAEAGFFAKLVDTVGTAFGGSSPAGRVDKLRALSKQAKEGTKNLEAVAEKAKAAGDKIKSGWSTEIMKPKASAKYGVKGDMYSLAGIYLPAAERLIAGKLPSELSAAVQGKVKRGYETDRLTPGLEAMAALCAVNDFKSAAMVAQNAKNSEPHSQALSKGYSIVSDMTAVLTFLASCATMKEPDARKLIVDFAAMQAAVDKAHAEAFKETMRLKDEAAARAEDQAKGIQADLNAEEERKRSERLDAEKKGREKDKVGDYYTSRTRDSGRY